MMPRQPNNSTNGSIWTISLPVIGAILVICTLPPLNFWPLGFISIAPIYIFIKANLDASWQRLSLGGFIFSFLFSAFLMSQTVLQFHWIKEAYLFSAIVKLAFIPVLALMSLFSSCTILALRQLLRRLQDDVFMRQCIAGESLGILIAAIVWTCSEWVIRKCMLSIEYSVLGYPAHSTFFISLASEGGAFLVVFFMALINTSAGALIYYIYKMMEQRAAHGKSYARLSLAPITMIVFACATAYAVHARAAKAVSSSADAAARVLKVATIQDQDRAGEAFGKETRGHFHFKALEDLIQQANAESPDIIIYPFAPWNGVIYDKAMDGQDAALFDKDVFATDFGTFGEWENAYVASGTVFATWATTYRQGKFFNEITYWKNGTLLGAHQKEHLFPFLDYTPRYAQSLGLYTTAVDAASGTSTLREKIGGVQVGALVCSEVTHPVADSTSRDADLILSIGSEAFFASGIAGDLNAANAAYRAAESGKPVIRSNRFGPSAFIDQTGKTTAYMPFGVTGVLVSEISVPIRSQEAAYFRASR